MTSPGTRTKVAIACQGGGSQTAFTAGALRRILNDPGLDDDYELVALSGTSGGALCCLLAWYGLILHADEHDVRGARAAELVTSFWNENAAHTWWDLLVTNPFVVGLHRMVDAGMLPATPPAPWVPGMVKNRLRLLLERLVPFEELPELLKTVPDHPTLLCGAVDVLSGEFAVFEETCPDPEWRRERRESAPPQVAVDTILASAAVPPLLPAVPLGNGLYWDGLYAHNPPIRSLVDRDHAMRPEEIWVLQIDPETTPAPPVTVVATVDRRFELSSNLSLNAELHWIRQVNQWVDQGLLPADQFKTIRSARIPLSTPLAERLDLASKVDRSPSYLRELMEDGEHQADAFLRERGDPDAAWWDPLFPHRYRPKAAVPG
jgi:NTE family protein